MKTLSFTQRRLRELELRKLRQSERHARVERAKLQRSREERLAGTRELRRERRKLARLVFTQFDSSRPMARVRAMLARFV